MGDADGFFLFVFGGFYFHFIAYGDRIGRSYFRIHLKDAFDAGVEQLPVGRFGNIPATG
jgi:hypothetical protein